MTESTMRQNVHKALKPLHAIAVENLCGTGTPDTNVGGALPNKFSDGSFAPPFHVNAWIELKWLRYWPVRSGTIVRLRHFTQSQRLWLRTRWRAGASSWLLLQVGQDWLLFDALTAYELVGKSTKKVLFEVAKKRFKGLAHICTDLKWSLTR